MKAINYRKIYFPNLNGLRFFAALFVIIYHIEQIKSLYNLDNSYNKFGITSLGGEIGVTFFFVLSGFLITYLLLNEEKNFSDINIGKFYLRRILRIWPLYFLILMFSLLILPNFESLVWPNQINILNNNNSTIIIILFVVMLPNIVLLKFGIVPYAAQTWSIGVEEQFYLIWPVFLKLIRRHRLMWMIAIVVLNQLLLLSFKSGYFSFIPYIGAVINYLESFRISSLAIGGIFALLLFKNHKLIAFLQNAFLFYLSITMVITILIFNLEVETIRTEIYSIIFGIIILNFASNNKIKISIENKFFNYLGKISYGLYMYHTILISLVIILLIKLNIFSNWILYPTSLCLTILVSGLSFKYYEEFFLRLKLKFITVKANS